MKTTPPLSPRTTRSDRHRRALNLAPPDPEEVAQLAHAVWLEEGARPGLKPQYQREVAFQLQLTRHLLAREIAGAHGDSRARVVLS